MERLLILNADDFGSCLAANEAIEELFEAGCLTSTTLMACCPFAEDAVRRALSHPGMRVGLHFTTTAELEASKWGPLAEDVPGLTDGDRNFFASAEDALRNAADGEMERELLAQYRWLAGRGIEPDHIDNHMGTVYGFYGKPHLEPVFRLCGEKAIGFRLPRQVPEGMEAMAARVSEAAAMADRLGVFLPDRVCTWDEPPEESYEAFREHYLALVRAAGEGVTELFVHPALPTEEAGRLYGAGPWGRKRSWEYRLLKDPVFSRTIEAEGIRLVSWKEAAAL